MYLMNAKIKWKKKKSKCKLTFYANSNKLFGVKICWSYWKTIYWKRYEMEFQS